MADINHVVLVGRLTRDAELKYTNTGLAVCRLSIAINRRVRNGEQWTDEANFFDVTAFGKQGEAVAQYLKKGGYVGVEGELRQDRWEKDGQKHSRVGVVASNLQLLGGRPQGSSGFRDEGSPSTPADGPGEFEDDIPF